MFGRYKTEKLTRYDPQRYTPVIRCSICNGEQVAGFLDGANGRMEEIMLLRDPEDLEQFKKTYGITGEIRKIY